MSAKGDSILEVRNPGKDPPGILVSTGKEMGEVAMELEVRTSEKEKVSSYGVRKRLREETGEKDGRENHQEWSEVSELEGKISPVILSGEVFEKQDQLDIYEELVKVVGEIRGKQLRSGPFMVHPESREQQGKILSLQKIGPWPVKVEEYKPSSELRGIIRGVPREYSGERLNEKWSQRGISSVVFLNSRKHESLAKEVQSQLTRTVVVTVQKGPLPDKLMIGFKAFSVFPFADAPLRCYKCQRFGHIAATCRGTVTCVQCAGPHEGKSCPEPARCSNCKGTHEASHFRCPARVTASKVVAEVRESGVSYYEARKAVRQLPKVSNQGYAAAVRSNMMVSSSVPQGRSNVRKKPGAEEVKGDILRPMLIPLLQCVVELVSKLLVPNGPMVQALKSALGVLTAAEDGR